MMKHPLALDEEEEEVVGIPKIVKKDDNTDSLSLGKPTSLSISAKYSSLNNEESNKSLSDIDETKSDVISVVPNQPKEMETKISSESEKKLAIRNDTTPIQSKEKDIETLTLSKPESSDQIESEKNFYKTFFKDPLKQQKQKPNTLSNPNSASNSSSNIALFFFDSTSQKKSEFSQNNGVLDNKSNDLSKFQNKNPFDKDVVESGEPPNEQSKISTQAAIKIAVNPFDEDEITHLVNSNSQKRQSSLASNQSTNLTAKSPSPQPNSPSTNPIQSKQTISSSNPFDGDEVTHLVNSNPQKQQSSLASNQSANVTAKSPSPQSNSPSMNLRQSQQTVSSPNDNKQTQIDLNKNQQSKMSSTQTANKVVPKPFDKEEIFPPLKTIVQQNSSGTSKQASSNEKTLLSTLQEHNSSQNMIAEAVEENLSIEKINQRIEQLKNSQIEGASTFDDIILKQQPEKTRSQTIESTVMENSLTNRTLGLKQNSYFGEGVEVKIHSPLVVIEEYEQKQPEYSEMDKAELIEMLKNVQSIFLDWISYFAFPLTSFLFNKLRSAACGIV